LAFFVLWKGAWCFKIVGHWFPFLGGGGGKKPRG
jgi:hypothetical protein